MMAILIVLVLNLTVSCIAVVRYRTHPMPRFRAPAGWYALGCLLLAIVTVCVLPGLDRMINDFRAWFLGRP